jgi:hypothetical protein
MECFDVARGTPYTASPEEEQAGACFGLPEETPFALFGPSETGAAGASPYEGMFDQAPPQGKVCTPGISTDEASFYAEEHDKVKDTCVANMQAYSAKRCEDGNLPLGMHKPDDMPIEACVQQWATGNAGGTTQTNESSSDTKSGFETWGQTVNAGGNVFGVDVGATVSHSSTTGDAVTRGSGSADTTNKRSFEGYKQRCEEKADRDVPDILAP